MAAEWWLIVLVFFAGEFRSQTYGPMTYDQCEKQVNSQPTTEEIVGASATVYRHSEQRAYCSPKPTPGEPPAQPDPAPELQEQIAELQVQLATEHDCRIAGDLNCDGQTNVADFTLFQVEFQKP